MRGFSWQRKQINFDNHYTPQVLQMRREYTEICKVLKDREEKCKTLYPACLKVLCEDIQHGRGGIPRHVKERIPGAAHQPPEHPHRADSANVVVEMWPEHGQTRSPTEKRANFQG